MNVLLPPKPEWEGQAMMGKVKNGLGGDLLGSMVAALKASRDGRTFVPTYFPRPGRQEAVPKLQYIVHVPEWNWFVGSGLTMDDVASARRTLLLQAGSVAALVLLVIGAAGWWTYRSVMQQLGGEPAVAANVVAQVAQGRLDATLPEAPAGSLMSDLRSMVAALRGTVGQVRDSSESVKVAAGEIAAGNMDLSQRTEETAANLQRTASAMEQLTSTVRATAEAAGTAKTLAGSAAVVAQRGGDLVGTVVHTMEEINDASARMADIIGTIDGISFQTNILALNAAVEAARAGEQGRGFAVVAGEVRVLAQRSAEAAKEIRTLITANMAKAGSGAEQVSDAGRTMREIVASVNTVARMVAQISAAASEKSQGIGDVHHAVSELDAMTQRNAALVEQSAAAASSLRDQSDRLAGAVGSFRV